MLISKCTGLSPAFLSIMEASRYIPNRKNSSIFPAELWKKQLQWGTEVTANVVIFAGGKFGEKCWQDLSRQSKFLRYFTNFLNKVLWVLFSRGGNFRKEDHIAKKCENYSQAKISMFTVNNGISMGELKRWKWKMILVFISESYIMIEGNWKFWTIISLSTLMATVLYKVWKYLNIKSHKKINNCIIYKELPLIWVVHCRLPQWPGRRFPGSQWPLFVSTAARDP